MKAFQCERTDCYYPADYVEMWGRKYGIGLGRKPISEAIVNLYGQPVAENKQTGSADIAIGQCHADINRVEVSLEEYESNEAILAIDDPYYVQRAALMREKAKIKVPLLIK